METRLYNNIDSVTTVRSNIIMVRTAQWSFRKTETIGKQVKAGWGGSGKGSPLLLRGIILELFFKDFEFLRSVVRNCLWVYDMTRCVLLCGLAEPYS